MATDPPSTGGIGLAGVLCVDDGLEDDDDLDNFIDNDLDGLSVDVASTPVVVDTGISCLLLLNESCTCGVASWA